MLFPPIDPNGRFRERRAAARRRRRLRRSALSALLLVAVLVLGAGARFVGGGTSASSGPTSAAPVASAAPAHSALPIEVRGVHVTMGLASLPGKLDDYLALQKDGMTAIELDVKDENGQIAFMTHASPLVSRVGATRDFYSPRAVAREVHARGLYLIGRVVTFDDPILAHARPDLAIRRSDGSVWEDGAGLAWTDPYDKRVWKYDVDVAAAAARAGFDEILFDYVRFPSDGDVGATVSANPDRLAKRDAVPSFLRYARSRLHPLGVRISAAVFGLSGSRDLGIGQLPRRMAPYVDAIYPMTYPSLFGPGELGLTDPSATPGATVSRALARFRATLRGRGALLVPWVQDWSFTRTYGTDEVRAQIQAARLAGAKGFMLWNAQGVYSDGTLGPSAG
ncbi:MAG TPA: putative glycoside hydrolase [Gaiellaceae bacterium]|nr:putative glycoside hydrolase [Gaiellaceae bacterium]